MEKELEVAKTGVLLLEVAAEGVVVVETLLLDEDVATIGVELLTVVV